MATKTQEVITIQKPKLTRLNIRIVGDTPLIMHNWDEKNKRMMLETQQGKAATKKKPCKMPFDDFARSLYWMTPMPTETIIDSGNGEMREVVTEELFEQALENGARFGFPANAFKMAGNAAAYRNGLVKNQMALRGAYFLKSDCGEVAWIRGSVPVMREDMVKVGMGSSDLRYRPMFTDWYCDLTLSINTGFGMTFDDIINVINAGGAGVGVGEWRPERDGIFGTYHVEIVK
jgi:hypothetical protein